MQKLIHMILDYAPGDLACAEVVSALAAQIPGDYHWHVTSVVSFDTISTGFVMAQLGMQSTALRPSETLIYANCAPRKDRSEARVNNEGEGFLYGVLKNGVRVLAVNAGHSCSFIRDDLAELWTIAVDCSGSQFRSRDNFPQLVGRAAREASRATARASSWLSEMRMCNVPRGNWARLSSHERRRSLAGAPSSSILFSAA